MKAAGRCAVIVLQKASRIVWAMWSDARCIESSDPAGVVPHT